MDPQDILAEPSCPSNFEYNTVPDSRASWGLEVFPRGAVGLCGRCHNHGIASQMGHEHICIFQDCQCHTCVFSEPRKASPTVTTLRKERGAQLKKQLVCGLIKSMAIAPGAPLYIKNMARSAAVHTGKMDMMPQPQAYPCYVPSPETPPGVLMFSQPSGPTSLSCAPVTMEQPLMLALPRQTHGPPLLPDIYSSLTHQPCDTLGPLLLQPQVPETSEQALVSASEWQQVVEAAEALLTLRNSCLARINSKPLAQPCGLPASAGDRTFPPPFLFCAPDQPPVTHCLLDI